MTTPDPRTDLAGYLGLTDDQAREECTRLYLESRARYRKGLEGQIGRALIAAGYTPEEEA